jgi:hypothetical protein
VLLKSHKSRKAMMTSSASQMNRNPFEFATWPNKMPLVEAVFPHALAADNIVRAHQPHGQAPQAACEW